MIALNFTEGVLRMHKNLPDLCLYLYYFPHLLVNGIVSTCLCILINPSIFKPTLLF